MSTLTLTRRKSQLELLAQVCEARTAAQLQLATSAPHQAHVQTCFLALQPNGLLIEWPRAGCGNIPISGSLVNVAFVHLEHALGFRTTTRGRVWWSSPGGGQVDAWMLTLPLRLDPAQRCPLHRVGLAGLAPVPARCTSIDDPQHTCGVELLDVSSAGLHATTLAVPADWLRPGILCWTEFELPGAAHRFEFVVRITHWQANTLPGPLVFECTFCPTEDPALHGRQMSRLEDFVAARDAGAQPRPGRSTAGG